MKSLRSITLATGVAALFAASPLYAVGDTTTEQQSEPQQLGGPGTSASQSIRSEAGDPSSRAESANQSSNTGSASDEGMAGSTGGQGQVDPERTQSSQPQQLGGPAGSSSEAISGDVGDSVSRSAGSGSAEIPKPLDSSTPSTSPSYEQ